MFSTGVQQANWKALELVFTTVRSDICSGGGDDDVSVDSIPDDLVSDDPDITPQRDRHSVIAIDHRARAYRRRSVWSSAAGHH